MRYDAIMRLGHATECGYDTERYPKEETYRTPLESENTDLEQGVTLVSMVSNPLENSQRHKTVTRTISELNLNTISVSASGF